MKCPNCKGQIKTNMNFCPFCGKKVFDSDKEYLVKIYCQGQREEEKNDVMKVFLDDEKMYEVKPGDSIVFSAKAGFHSLKFRRKIRAKTIQIMLNTNYVIRSHFNSLTGLIETAVNNANDMSSSERKSEFKDISISEPVLSSDSSKWEVAEFDKDKPDYEIRATSGLKEGTLFLYAEKCEFVCSTDIKTDITDYRNVLKIQRKMGSIALECEGKIHKVYSIPKDSYNEVIAYLNNHIEALKADG